MDLLSDTKPFWRNSEYWNPKVATFGTLQVPFRIKHFLKEPMRRLSKALLLKDKNRSKFIARS